MTLRLEVEFVIPRGLQARPFAESPSRCDEHGEAIDEEDLGDVLRGWRRRTVPCELALAEEREDLVGGGRLVETVKGLCCESGSTYAIVLGVQMAVLAQRDRFHCTGAEEIHQRR